MPSARSHGERGPEVVVPADTAQHSTANCPAGQRVVSGGGTAIADGLAVSEPEVDRSGWYTIAYSSTISGTIQATALCAPSGRATVASAQAVTREIRAKQATVEARARRSR